MPSQPPPSRDGSSFERAILVGDISDEYAWVERTYPGATCVIQMLAREDGGKYDILTLELKSGEWRRVYFDLTDLPAHRKTRASDED